MLLRFLELFFWFEKIYGIYELGCGEDGERFFFYDVLVFF
jgi:hypothetical protein